MDYQLKEVFFLPEATPINSIFHPKASILYPPVIELVTKVQIIYRYIYRYLPYSAMLILKILIKLFR